MNAEAPSFAAQLGGTALALAFVLALAWFGLRALKRLQQRAAGGQAGSGIQVLRQAPLGAREKLVAVRYRDREYLLAVTAGGTTVVDRWPAGEPAAPQPD